MSEQIVEEPVSHLDKLGESVATLEDLGARAQASGESGFRGETSHVLGEALAAVAGALRSVHVLFGGNAKPAPTSEDTTPFEGPIASPRGPRVVESDPPDRFPTGS